MKNAVITRTDADPATARDGFLDDPHAPLANTSYDFALGNFFRIIVFDVIRFFDSVSRGARVFESRGIIF
jgi:hypothetical protein